MGRLAVLLTVLCLAGCAPDFATSPSTAGPPRPSDPSVGRFDATALVADDGHRLPLVTFMPLDAEDRPAPVRAVIVAVHGFNDRKAAFDMPAALWQHAGIATYAYDQRGFGANPEAGRWPGSRSLAQDLTTAIRAARARHKGIPVYALGDSMGGAVVLDAVAGATGAEPARPDGVILAAPAVWGRDTETPVERVALWLASRTIPAMRFTGEGFGIQASDNLPMLRALGRDPLFIKATRIDVVYGLVDLMDEANAAARSLHGPALILYGAHDELIPPKAFRGLIAALPEVASGRQRVAYYRDGWHMILRDLDYRLVATDVIRWIDDHAAPLPSGADRAAAAFLAGSDAADR